VFGNGIGVASSWVWYLAVTAFMPSMAGELTREILSRRVIAPLSLYSNTGEIKRYSRFSMYCRARSVQATALAYRPLLVQVISAGLIQPAAGAGWPLVSVWMSWCSYYTGMSFRRAFSSPNTDSAATCQPSMLSGRPSRARKAPAGKIWIEPDWSAMSSN
jgi:hypothetical protein